MSKEHTHDHIADATQKVQPSPAPLPMPEGIQQARDSMRQYFDDTVHPNDSYSVYCQLVDDLDTMEDHISDLTRRLAEAEAENGRFAGRLESSVSDWRKLYTEERAERVRIEGILLNDVQAERQESDEHINGLDTVIKTQDKTIRDIKSRAESLEAERDALRERCEKLEWLVEVQEFYMYRLRNPGGWSTPGMERAKIGVAWQRRSAANGELRAMYLAATEVK